MHRRQAYANGIFLESGSNNNIVMNSTILRAQTQNAIAVQSSNDNSIVGNTITGGPFFDGILLNSNVGLAGPGSSRIVSSGTSSRATRTDGITLTDASLANYIGLNTTVSSSYTAPNSTVNAGANGGVGVWVNDGSKRGLRIRKRLVRICRERYRCDALEEHLHPRQFRSR